ncbi:MAG: hypothetical protein ACYS22_09120 [Planctomycetota bacterium]|jgi:hypothetical protein
MSSIDGPSPSYQSDIDVSQVSGPQIDPADTSSVGDGGSEVSGVPSQTLENADDQWSGFLASAGAFIQEVVEATSEAYKAQVSEGAFVQAGDQGAAGLKERSLEVNADGSYKVAGKDAQAQVAGDRAHISTQEGSIARDAQGQVTTTGKQTEKAIHGERSHEVSAEQLQQQLSSGRLREELKFQTTSTRGALYNQDALEVSSGPKTDRSKWDEASTKVEGGKWSSTRETTYTDKDEIKRSSERGVKFGEPASPELKKALAKKAQNISNAQSIAADVFGLKKEVKGKSEATAEAALHKTSYKSADGKTEADSFIGARAKATAEGKASYGADGLRAEGKLDARAGLYEEVSGKKTGDYGTVEGGMGVKAEVYATATGSAKLDLNGLEVKAKVEVGGEISASVNGKYTTPPVKIGGVDVTAGVEAKGKASLEAKAYAEGKVAFTRHPPRAVLEGEAGASAVAKLEGEVKGTAGPFSVAASGYVSAGAEAKASGVIGYDDGKLKIGGSLGAALGIGAGGKVQVEVDLKMIKDMGVGLTKEAYAAVKDELAEAASDVADFASDVGDAVGDAVDAVGDAAGDAVDAVGDTLSDAGDAVSSGASKVANFFGF